MHTSERAINDARKSERKQMRSAVSVCVCENGYTSPESGCEADVAAAMHDDTVSLTENILEKRKAKEKKICVESTTR